MTSQINPRLPQTWHGGDYNPVRQRDDESLIFLLNHTAEVAQVPLPAAARILTRLHSRGG